MSSSLAHPAIFCIAGVVFLHFLLLNPLPRGGKSPVPCCSLCVSLLSSSDFGCPPRPFPPTPRPSSVVIFYPFPFSALAMTALSSFSIAVFCRRSVMS